MVIGDPMIPGGAVFGGGEVSGVPDAGVGLAGTDRVGDGADEGSWAPSPLPPGCGPPDGRPRPPLHHVPLPH